MNTYAWKRFWVSTGTSPRLSEGGYLTDPDQPGSEMLNDDAFAWETLRDTPCLILLGEPGMGKSWEMKSAAQAANPPSLRVDMAEFSSEQRFVESAFETPEFANWLASTTTLTLMFDSLDESLLHIRTVATLLAAKVATLPTSRLRLRIACRRAEWPELLHNRLGALWGESDYKEVELAPLRRCDVAAAATTEGIDPDTFLEAVSRNDLEPLASRPIALRLLLWIWRADGALPAAAAEIYEKGCQALCRDPSQSRAAAGHTGRLSASERLDVASCIAAATLFCRRPAVFHGRDPMDANQDLLVEDLIGIQMGIERPAVTREAVREVLGTGLFSGGGGSRAVWGHWTFPEFLAARFLSLAGLSDGQVADLLLRTGSDGRMRVVPQLREVAAWAVAQRPALRAQVIAGDPWVLLRAQTAVLGTDARAQIVAALLDLAARGQLADTDFDMHRQYRVLTHPDLPDQLHPRIVDRDANAVVRRIAIDMAAACACTSLAQPLLEVALDASEDAYMRAQAGHAILALDQDAQKAALRPLLDCPTEQDPDDELRGIALEALWPSHVSTEELLDRYLATPNNSHMYGGQYAQFIWQLPARLRPQDLAPALRWVVTRGPDHYECWQLAKLPSSIMKAASTELERDEIASAFVDAAFHRIQQHDPILAEGSATAREDVALAADQAARRRLVLALVARVARTSGSGKSYQAYRLSRLLVRSDFAWSVGQLVAATPLNAVVWSDLVERLFDPDDLTHTETLFAGARPGSSLYPAMRSWVDPVELGSQRERTLRAAHESWKDSTAVVEPPEETVVHAPLEKIEACLDSSQRGDLDGWWQLNFYLTLPQSDIGSTGAETEADLTLLPGWPAMNDSQRDRCFDAALRYLQLADPGDAQWLGRDIPRPAAAGYRALRLLLKEAPDRLGVLEATDYGRWAASCLAFPESIGTAGEGPMHDAIALVWAKAPDALLRALDELFERANREDGTIRITAKLARAWDDTLARFALDRIANASLRGSSIGVLLDEAMLTLPDAATATALDLVEKRTQDEYRWAARYAAVTLLTNCPAAVWPQLSAVFVADSAFLYDVFETLGSGWRRPHRRELSQELPEDALADLYLWLYAKVPELRSPTSGHVDARDVVLHLRDGILGALKRRGTAASVAAMRRVAEELKAPVPWLWLDVLEAEDARLQAGWTGITLQDLKRLTSSNSDRVVSSVDAAPAPSKTQVVLLVHGIRTQAEWQEKVAGILRQAGVNAVRPIRYGYFDALRFWLPFTRGAPIRRVRREIDAAIERYPGHELSILAHSFGTYAIGELLEEHPNLRLHRLALCGSILPRDFRWDRYMSQVNQLVNDCGTRDIWPVLAATTSWGYGASGTNGFGAVGGDDRFHDFGHSDFFTEDFARTYWVPFFLAGDIRASKTDRQPTPLWFSWLEKAKVKYLAPLLLAVAIGFAWLLPTRIEPQHLRVQVLDAETLLPLDGVTIALPEYRLEATTGKDGQQAFALSVPQETRVGLRAHKPGYVTRNIDPPVGEGLQTYKMRREN